MKTLVIYKKPYLHGSYWISLLVQFRISDFGRRQHLWLAELIYSILDNFAYSYYVVIRSVRE